MYLRRSAFIGLALLAGAYSSPAANAAPSGYTVTKLFSTNQSCRLDNSGRVLGTVSSNNGWMGVVWEKGNLHQLSPLAGGRQTRAMSINSSGVIAGNSDGRAVVWENYIPRLAGDQFFLIDQCDINDSGDMVLSGHTAGVTGNAWRLSGNTLVNLDPNNDVDIWNNIRISNNGDIAGSGDTYGTSYSYYWHDGERKKLDFDWVGDINENGEILGGYRTGVSGIWKNNSVTAMPLGFHGGMMNNKGEVVGICSFAGENFQRAYLMDSTGLYDINSLVTSPDGAVFSGVAGINDSGQILASTNNVDYYLLTPNAVPEPSSIAAMLAGCGVMGLGRFRLRKKTS